MAAAGIELNLPDLPEVPIQLGPAGKPPGRPAQRPVGIRLRDALTAYLPLLMMVALALGTWWLVKNSPKPLVPRAEGPPRTEPDYTMRGFAVQRFAKDGQLRLTLEGRQLRHFPDSDRTEIEELTLRARHPDGRETVATARRALANGDATEVQLLGGAQLRAQSRDGRPIEVDSEFLHFFTDTERVQSHLPVKVRAGDQLLSAGGLALDHLQQLIELKAPIHAVLPAHRASGRP